MSKPVRLFRHVSQLFDQTLRDTLADADIISYRLFMRAESFVRSARESSRTCNSPSDRCKNLIHPA